MTNNFKQYYLPSLITWNLIGLLAILAGYISNPEISLLLGFKVLLACLAIGLIFGFRNYRFYVKSAPKIISNLLGKTPLREFKSIGFLEEGDNMICGYINNYYISLAPTVNTETKKRLLILIFLELREGLEDYFEKFDELFKLHLPGDVLFLEAIIENYGTSYDFEQLFALLKATTLNLQEKKIMPIKIVDD